MSKKSRSFRDKLDIPLMVADFAILIYTGIFLPRSLLLILIGISLAVVMYTLILKRPMRKLGYFLIVTGFAVGMALPANWLWGWWDQRGLHGDFEQESASAMVVNQSILDGLQGAAEKEKLKTLATAMKKNLTDGQTIAQLEIPRIGVNGIVIEGTEDASLRKGIGHVEETFLPGMEGNFAAAGDRVLYGAPFLNLNEMEPGDEVIVKTTYGKFLYTVTRKVLTDPEDVSVLQSTGVDIITLITCDPPWGTSHRLIIQGTLSSSSLL